jgi:hypothetical protein
MLGISKLSLWVSTMTAMKAAAEARRIVFLIMVIDYFLFFLFYVVYRLRAVPVRVFASALFDDIFGCLENI